LGKGNSTVALTAHHAKYYAYELTRQGGEGISRLSRSLFDACVDLNPHQIEAALFALRSPVSKGVLLADEVGLGKTVEAGIVLCQCWAERKRRLLVICPASLRKQWAIELEEKFNLPSLVLDARSYRQAKADGNPIPFDQSRVVITSMHFASQFASDVTAIAWDLVVIDEAHKLRNAYRESNRIGQNICRAIYYRRKILLTATPLQNSLLELYGLSTLIDDRIFGDLPSFRTQYTGANGDLDALRTRIQGFSKRTLRAQVQEYVQYTERKPITRPFTPSENEHNLYEAVSAFLQREDTYSFPKRQRHLTTLIVRKLLASSPNAVAGTLETLRDRLIELRDNIEPAADLATRLIENEEIEDDWLDELLDGQETEATADGSPETSQVLNREKLKAEIDELDRFITWARSIGIDTKTRTLLKALEVGFAKMTEIGASQKSLIFTESRRTQQFLRDFLESNGYAGQVVTFNGSNAEPASTEIYQRWVEANKDTGRVSGSRPVDVRTALIEHFRDKASIMIATEAAAEGINLQFCSLVVNYDLPWNPQRIEQRIGRCHRYGQKHDVVVINFINERNAADRRVYELLNDKFSLFSGIFGASDEVLGTIEAGVDFERRVLDIYQECRTTEEIEAAFQALRAELDESISTRIQDTRSILMEHFDEDVHERLKVNLTGARDQLDRMGRMFWALTQFVLGERAFFDTAGLTFQLHDPPSPAFHPGMYHLISKNHANVPGDFLYRLSHPLGEHVLDSGKQSDTPLADVKFDITHHPARIAVVETLKNRSGWLTLQRLVIDSLVREEFLLFSALDDKGNALDQETCEKLFNCAGAVQGTVTAPEEIEGLLRANADRHVQAAISKSLELNNRHFQEARDQLDRWAEDMVIAAERELRDTKEQIKALNRQARQAATLAEQYEIQGRIRELETKKRNQRRRIFDAEDEITAKRDELIGRLEKRMQQRSTIEHLFSIRWSVV